MQAGRKDGEEREQSRDAIASVEEEEAHGTSHQMVINIFPCTL